MKTSKRIIIGTAALVTILGAGLATAQDPIVIDNEPGGGLTWTNQSNNDATPGLPTEIRADIVTESYTMQVDTDAGKIDVERVTFRLRGDEEYRRRKVEIELKDGLLEFKVAGDTIGKVDSQRCKPHDDKCTGNGIPGDMYGRVKGDMKAYKSAADRTGIVVYQVLIHCKDCTAQQAR